MAEGKYYRPNFRLNPDNDIDLFLIQHIKKAQKDGRNVSAIFRALLYAHFIQEMKAEVDYASQQN